MIVKCFIEITSEKLAYCNLCCFQFELGAICEHFESQHPDVCSFIKTSRCECSLCFKQFETAIDLWNHQCTLSYNAFEIIFSQI